MVQLLRHDTYKYPLEEKKKSSQPRQLPVVLDIIDDQDLEVHHAPPH